MTKRKRMLSLLCILLIGVLLCGSAMAAGNTLRRGSRGDEVKQLQGNLIELGYLSGRADGIFGPATEAAVKRYQRAAELAADGVYGPKTAAKLTAEVLMVIRIVELAKSFLGTPYVYGGTSPAGFDCSGFTQYVFAKASVTIPRVSYEQARAGISVPYSKMRPGDIVCFNSPVDHVGIYLGNGKFIHSPKTGDVVKITDLKYMDLTAIRRYTGAVG